jgi:hypothetical protein
MLTGLSGRRGLVPTLLAAIWLAVGALLLRIGFAGRFDELAAGPVGRSGVVAIVGLVLPAIGLLAAVSMPRIGGGGPPRLSVLIGIAVAILGCALIAVGHSSAVVIVVLGLAGAGLVGGWLRSGGPGHRSGANGPR